MTRDGGHKITSTGTGEKIDIIISANISLYLRNRAGQGYVAVLNNPKLAVL